MATAGDDTAAVSRRAHMHCPDDCDHPQPFKGDDGKAYCGRCWFKFGELVAMVPCTPEICGD